jgi:SAM-dependent methyltransferase
MATEFAHAMRAAELDQAISKFPPSGKLLELGAGDGWQANVLQQRGFDVTAIDVEAARHGAVQHFPVSLYDGRTLPFPDGSFDAIYSSNVLEHVIDFAQIQAELARVLRPAGVAVHCVPSAVWRTWTTLGHPIYAARLAWRLKNSSVNHTSPNVLSPSAKKLPVNVRPLGLLRMGLISPRHGEHGNLISEHWLFRHRSWVKRFEETGWSVDSVTPAHLFYTGNELLGLRMATYFRRGLASMLGSSTVIYSLHPRSQLTHL